MLSEDTESIYIGLLQLTGKIIDNFDITKCEKVVESKRLIDEIFVNFLFKAVFDQGGDENKQIVTKVKPKRLYGEVDAGKAAEEKGGLGKKSKDAAYRLINQLIKKSPLFTLLPAGKIPQVPALLISCLEISPIDSLAPKIFQIFVVLSGMMA